ncbi:hypothetical protein ACOJQI_01200 [Bacillus salacetis]|uniref:hypothetical protein n=1 Tax=Bacillus salacetis TaxID=2315464 RepID=UPI003BA202FC
MRRLGGLLILFLVLLAGCAGVKDEGSTISIKPHSLSEEEEILISKTGVDGIQFFKLDGTLEEVEDLQFAMEIYKDGKLVDDRVYTHGQVEKEFDQALISYGIDRQDNKITFLNGIINGLIEQTEDVDGVQASSFTTLLNEKKKLVKDEAVYLTAWVGTSENGMEAVSINEDGALSDDIESAEIGYVFKVTLTDYGKE